MVSKQKPISIEDFLDPDKKYVGAEEYRITLPSIQPTYEPAEPTGPYIGDEGVELHYFDISGVLRRLIKTPSEMDK